MSNPVTEQELKEKAKAPRVTQEALEANIKQTDFYIHPGSQLTICIITLQNGYTVTGQSACADPENFNKDIGERIAKENAVKQIWSLMGYALKEELYRMGEGSTFLDRLRKEHTDLTDKINKLNAFITGNVQFYELPNYERDLLANQLEVMQNYQMILGERLTFKN